MVADATSSDPVIALAAPRPDFNGSLTEFLIGLLTVAMDVTDEDAWLELWHNPPTPDELRAKLAQLPNAFELDGAGPRFLQDYSVAELASIKVAPIEQLLIDAPGDQTTSFNKDLFVKRGRVTRLGRPAAAMALLSMQTYAPSGGQGHRTSMRGGGPLTTIVEPRVLDGDFGAAAASPIWQLLWANVETTEQWVSRTPKLCRDSPPDRFPWLESTCTSENDEPTTPSDAHPLQAYFGMPQRIRLEFGGEGTCELTGERDAALIDGFRKRNYGTRYVGWQHPLSPYYRKDMEWLPVHGQPGGVAWRDWLGLTLTGADSSRNPAKTISHFITHRADALQLRQFRIHAFGYDMDNMKARAWTDAHLPAFIAADAAGRQLMSATAMRLTSGTDIAASALAAAVRNAVFETPPASSKDTKERIRKQAQRITEEARVDLWANTAQEFYAAIRFATEPTSDAAGIDLHVSQFREALERLATAIFGAACPDAGASPNAARRTVVARFELVMMLSGRSKLGAKLFDTLRLPRPESAGVSKSKKPRRKKEAGT